MRRHALSLGLLLFLSLAGCAPANEASSGVVPATVTAAAVLLPAASATSTAPGGPLPVPSETHTAAVAATPSPAAELEVLALTDGVLQSTDCHFTLVVPDGWEALNDPDSAWFQDRSVGPCVLGLRPMDWRESVQDSELDLPQYPLTVAVASAPAEQVSYLVFIEPRDSEWVVTGRQGYEEPAESSQVGGNLLVRGVGAFGLYTKETASYAGIGEAARAFLWDGGNRTALFEELLYAQTSVLDQVIQSFAFR